MYRGRSINTEKALYFYIPALNNEKIKFILRYDLRGTAWHSQYFLYGIIMKNSNGKIIVREAGLK
jgi:hypothetical protein